VNEKGGHIQDFGWKMLSLSPWAHASGSKPEQQQRQQQQQEEEEEEEEEEQGGVEYGEEWMGGGGAVGLRGGAIDARYISRL
jgi:ribosomal protein L12E/L44/L45/RPP1/RPP2